jgi:curved DNA-binding protein CbpA
MQMADPFIEKTYYEILGVLPDASEREIRHKYRKLALAHHPDKGGDETLFKSVKHAAECLLDRKLRADYDRLLKEMRTEMFPEVPATKPDGEELKEPTEQAKKRPRATHSDWWFHDMYSEIEELYHESLREQFDFGTRPMKPKPFSEPGRKRSTNTTNNRFRRPSLERLWMDRGLN